MNLLFWLGKWFNFICNIIIYFQNLIFEIVTTRDLPSSVKLTKSEIPYAKWKSTVCYAMQEVIYWSYLPNECNTYY